MTFTILRSIGGIAAGIAVTFILVIAVEFFGSIVHPFPDDFDKESFEELCQHVANYPAWVLALVVPVWSLTAFIGTWIAGRLGNRASAAILGFLLLTMVILNIAMLPYPIWFKIAGPIAIAVAGACGYRMSSRRAIAAVRLDSA